MPQPNGYDDILRAAKLAAETTHHYRTMPEAELRQLVMTNTAALKELRIGLARECRVPVENSRDYIDRHIPDLSGIKRLAMALAAEGLLAELDGRTNDAVRSYMDAIQLGQKSTRGGLLIHGLVGFACESIGSAGVASIVSSLDAEQCRAFSKELELLNAQREPPEAVLRNERTWARRTFGPLVRLGLMISRRSWDPFKPNQKNYAARDAAQVVQQSQLIIDLATRAYALEKDQPPTNLSELVPDYLTSIPPESSPQSR